MCMKLSFSCWVIFQDEIHNLFVKTETKGVKYKVTRLKQNHIVFFKYLKLCNINTSGRRVVVTVVEVGEQLTEQCLTASLGQSWRVRSQGVSREPPPGFYLGNQWPQTSSTINCTQHCYSTPVNPTNKEPTLIYQGSKSWAKYYLSKNRDHCSHCALL